MVVVCRQCSMARRLELQHCNEEGPENGVGEPSHHPTWGWAVSQRRQARCTTHCTDTFVLHQSRYSAWFWDSSPARWSLKCFPKPRKPPSDEYVYNYYNGLGSAFTGPCESRVPYLQDLSHAFALANRWCRQLMTMIPAGRHPVLGLQEELLCSFWDGDKKFVSEVRGRNGTAEGWYPHCSLNVVATIWRRVSPRRSSPQRTPCWIFRSCSRLPAHFSPST